MDSEYCIVSAPSAARLPPRALLSLSLALAISVFGNGVGGLEPFCWPGGLSRSSLRRGSGNDAGGEKENSGAEQQNRGTISTAHLPVLDMSTVNTGGVLTVPNTPSARSMLQV